MVTAERDMLQLLMWKCEMNEFTLLSATTWQKTVTDKKQNV
jgi:hypothetical protein